MTNVRTTRHATQRRQMIQDTEHFLARHLPVRRTPSRQQETPVNGNDTRPLDTSTRRVPGRRDTRGDLSSARPGSWIEPAVNADGELDEEHLGILSVQLYGSARFRDGDLLVDLTDVRTVTPGFWNMIHAMERYLAEQNRRLFVLGANQLPRAAAASTTNLD